MQTFQLSLTDETVAGLQLSVDEFNVQTGQSLTLEDWIVLSLQSKAIEWEINSDSKAIKEIVDVEVPRRIDARRRELIRALGPCRAVRVSPDDTG